MEESADNINTLGPSTDMTEAVQQGQEVAELSKILACSISVGISLIDILDFDFEEH